MTPSPQHLKEAREIKRLVITMEPERFLNDGAVAFRIRVDADNKWRFEQVQVVEASHFKSIGEMAFNVVVKKFRNQMGWRT